MNKQWRGRVLTLIALICLAFATLLPTLTRFMYPGEEVLPKGYLSFFKNRLILGLDLRGGSHLQYKVDVREALINKSRNLAARLTQEIGETDNLKDLKGAKVTVKPTDEGTIEEVSELTITFDRVKHFDTFREQGVSYLESYHQGYQWLSDDRKTKSVKIGLRRDEISQFQEGALDQAIETIERRINAFGVAESSVSRRDQDKIVVELPGLKDEDSGKAKEKLAQTGLLHFKIVEHEESKISEFFTKVRARQPKKDAWPQELKGKESHKIYVDENVVRSTSLEVLKYMVGDLLNEDIAHIVGY
jgi:preprotein translocase subunit SecD